jgi:hypothetical protein
MLGVKRVLCVVAFMMMWSCKDDSGPTDPQTAAGSTTTLTGTVIDGYTTPCPGVTIRIPGHSDVVTASDGTFSVPYVITPYDIAVLDIARNTGKIYVGLASTSPTFISDVPSQSQPRKATIQLTAPSAPGMTTTIIFAGMEMPLYGPIDSTATWNVQWGLPVDSVVTDVFLVRHGGGALSISCNGTARKSLTIRAGGSHALAFQSAELVDPPEADITGTILPSGGQSPVNVSYYDARFDCGGQRLPIGGVTGYSTAFKLTVPIINGISFALHIEGTNGIGSSRTFLGDLTPGASGATVTLLGPPVLGAPSANANNIDSVQTLTWTAPAPVGVYRILLTPKNGDGPSYSVYTSAAGFDLGKLYKLAWGLKSGSYYTWEVEHQPWISTIDDVAVRKNAIAISWCSKPFTGSAKTWAREFQVR